MTRTLISLLLYFSAVNTALGQPAIKENFNNTGIFYGKIYDASTQKVIEGATVQIVQNRYDTLTGKKRETILATQLSNKKGEFNIENIPVAGSFKLKVSSIGYKSFDSKISFDSPEPKTGNTTLPAIAIKDLGNFKMFPDATQLENITVNANKPLFEAFLDKKIYNVEKDLSAAGGTATDVIKNIPGILVDMDGNVSVRNAAPQIFVDGRPSTLTLDQIPSDHIASIEIMTNPSAKYDASGAGAGILNIILKKNKRTGYNGSLRANIDSRLRPGGGGDINIKQNKVNFFAAAQLNKRKSISDQSTDRIEYPANGSITTMQNNRPVNRGYFGFGRTGVDLLLTNRTTLSLSGNYSKGNFKVKDLLNISRDTVTNMGSISESSLRKLNADIDFKNTGASIGIKHNFAETGKEWTADANYNKNRNKNISNYSSRYFDNNGNEKPFQGAERAEGGSTTSFYTFQTDFTNPITKNIKFETGLRAVFRSYESWNDNFRQIPPSTVLSPLTSTNVEFDFDDAVYAAYSTYSQQIKKFSFQLGLRAERSNYKGHLISKNERFSNDYPVSLFPSVFLSQKINSSQDLQLNYSRKINRPGFFQILPFVDFSDSLNLSVGNPDLRPEFAQLLELSYNNNFKAGHSILATAYARFSDNLITRYQYKDLNTDPLKTDSVIYNSFANANKSSTFGLEITGKNKLTKFWEITSNINLFNVTLDANNIAGARKEQLFSWFAKINNSFKLPADFSLQLTGDYQAKTLLPANSGRSSSGSFGGGVYGFTQNLAQGYIKPIYGVDISVRKEFLKNNTAAITLQFSDILRSRKYETHASTGFFVQNNFRLRDPQLVRLNLSWRFGKFDAALIKRKNTRSEQDNLQIQQGNTP